MPLTFSKLDHNQEFNTSLYFLLFGGTNSCKDAELALEFEFRHPGENTVTGM